MPVFLNETTLIIATPITIKHSHDQIKIQSWQQAINILQRWLLCPYSANKNTEKYYRLLAPPPPPDRAGRVEGLF
jgi:hypothetical protein